jgi:peptidoglycan hydrolase-like protein with peptidoglycan-binding domain
MQYRLNQVGNYGIKTDRYYGQATTEAVFDFQVTRGLPATGICDWVTWALLFPAEGNPWFDDLNEDGIIGPMEMTGE